MAELKKRTGHDKKNIPQRTHQMWSVQAVLAERQAY